MPFDSHIVDLRRVCGETEGVYVSSQSSVFRGKLNDQSVHLRNSEEQKDDKGKDCENNN